MRASSPARYGLYWLRAILAMHLCLLVGCWDFGVPSAALDNPHTEQESNDSFLDAEPVFLNAAGRVQLQGTLGSADIDVFDLGPLAVGDHIVVDVDTPLLGGLRVAAGIFDAEQELLLVKDPVYGLFGPQDPYLDAVVLYDSDHYYIALTTVPGFEASGSYVARVEVDRGGLAHVPTGQALLLNFAGGQNIRIRNVGVFDIPPFNAADVDPAYAGQTEALKAIIVGVVADRFSAFDVTLVTSDDLRPVGDYSTVHFGTAKFGLFGEAEHADYFNRDPDDQAIVYTTGFATPFTTTPTLGGIGLAIGQVAAHEAGHLLGLIHTQDVSELMDATGGPGTLLGIQTLKPAAIHVETFPIGLQDGFDLLLALLGSAAVP